MTNGDKIRQMSNEELTETIHNNLLSCTFCIYNDINDCKKGMCKVGIKAYLDMEVE